MFGEHPLIAGDGATQRGLLLLAEDDPLSRRVTLAALKRTGYRVDVVTDGVEAIAAVRERRYDAVLMDCEMPRMAGTDAAAVIRSLETGRRLPIIALSAYGDDDDRRRALDSGMDDFLAKPCTTIDLLSALARWVSPDVVR